MHDISNIAGNLQNGAFSPKIAQISTKFVKVNRGIGPKQITILTENALTTGEIMYSKLKHPFT